MLSKILSEFVTKFYFWKVMLGYFIAVFVLTACTDSLDRNEFMNWTRDYSNGLHAKQASNGIIFDLQFKPLDYVLLQTPGFSSQNRNQLEQEVGGLQYYDLSISPEDLSNDIVHHGVSSVTEVQQSLYYYSYLFQNDIYLEQGGKKLPCVLYHFERSVDLKPSRIFQLGFEGKNEYEESVLVIQSERLSSLPIRIKISNKDIPKLTL